MDYPVLILGGTGEARALAAELAARGVPVVSSLAGRVARPRLPAGETRVGGFGGPEGLAAWLAEHQACAVVDATHPFAERISESAVKGAWAAGVPLLRLQRPGWAPLEGSDWRWVESLEEAARILPEVGERIFLTSGRQGLPAFAHLTDLWFLIRVVDPPTDDLPPQRLVILDRGPYTVERESALMREHRIDALVTKDSGGPMTMAKLEAARDLGVPVVVVRRPPQPDAETVTDVDRAVEWVLTRTETT